MSQTGAVEQYRPDIDGVRAIAVIAVVLFHAFPSLCPAGFLGVDVFFVISGFLITRLILAGVRSGKFTIAGFYARRMRRLLPALVTILIAVFVAGWLLLLPGDAENLGREIVAGALFVANFEYWREVGYFDRAAALKPLLHLWSLGVEEQFYLTWPLLLMLAAKRAKLIAAVVLVASFALAVIVAQRHPAAAFFLPVTRFWELMAGAILADIRWRIGSATWRWIGAMLGLVLVLVSFAGASDEVSAAWRLLPVAGTALLIFSGPDNGLNRAVLGNQVAVGIGKISYPLYLWHWPLLSMLALRSLPDPVPAGARAIAVGVSVVLAILTYRFIEMPVRFGRRRRWAVPALGTAIVGIACLGAVEYASGGFPSRFPQPIRSYVTFHYDLTSDARVGSCWLDGSAPPDGFQQSCYRPGSPGHAGILVWGDSHAGRFYAGLRTEMPKADVGELVRDSCPPILGWGYPACATGNESIMSWIGRSRPDTVVMVSAWNQQAAGFDRAEIGRRLVATIRKVHDAGVRRVILVGPVPQWTEDLPRVLYGQWRATGQVPERTQSRLLVAAFDVDRQLKTLLAPEPVTYFSPIDALCDARGCLTRVGDGPSNLLSVDYGHLTTPGARYLVRAMKLDR